jgi:hypothetical protein
MHEEYAAPRMQDVAWADVIAFGTPASPANIGTELSATLAAVAAEMSPEVLSRKGATAFTSTYGAMEGAEQALATLGGRLLQLGFVTMPPPPHPAESGWEDQAREYEAARIHGRLTAALGRALIGWNHET